MTDMLVKLYALPALDAAVGVAASRGVMIRRAMAFEQDDLLRWVSKKFNPLWVQESRTAFGRSPIGLYLAVCHQEIAGFCCLDTTFVNFVGPIGIAVDQRAKGVGRALLLTCLYELKSCGFAYGIIGNAGEPVFFEKAAGATAIADSDPGPYPKRLRVPVSMGGHHGI
ncbi:MAG: GNAT family N-acetyltransferase [Desulfatitalea sp.]|nr:GNAT family N-acetyltransferase [Desulfatitalea sp.]NNK01692.1 GNAT family N-acetyltransferase [Desulfatitalea sp.]